MFDDHSPNQASLITLHSQLKVMERGLRIMSIIGMSGFIMFVGSIEAIKYSDAFMWLAVVGWIAMAFGIFGLFHLVNIVVINQKISRSLKFAVANIEASLEERKDV